MPQMSSAVLVLSDRDLDFVAQVVAPDSKNTEKMKQAIRGEPAFRKTVLGDKKIFEEVMKRSPAILRVSPPLFFEILLRQTKKGMEKRAYTLERMNYQAIPVFDRKEAIDFLSNEEIFYYLVLLLSSFVRIEKGTPNDVDINSLIKQSKDCSPEFRFAFYRRVADVCLFILGMFPEFVTYDYYYLFSGKKPPAFSQEARGIADYEWLGREFYKLAAMEEAAKITNMKEVLLCLSENLYLAKKPLNFISEQKLCQNPSFL